MTKRDRWILSEFLVALDRESCTPEVLIAHRLRTPYAEIDLLFERRGARPLGESSEISYTVVEVKSVDEDLWGRPPLTKPQKLRLERARFWLESKSRAKVRLLLACVNERGRITYFEPPF